MSRVTGYRYSGTDAPKQKTWKRGAAPSEVRNSADLCPVMIDEGALTGLLRVRRRDRGGVQRRTPRKP